MKKYIISAAVLLVVLALSASAHAEDGADVKIKERKVKTIERGVKSEVKKEIKDLRGGAKDAIKNVKEEFGARKDEAKAKMEEGRAALKEKVAKIKDEKKKEAIERVATKFNEINVKLVSSLNDAVLKIEGVLGRIEARAEKLSTNGIDVTMVRKAIAEAKTAIEKARVMVTEQGSKVYSVADVITAESKLKADVGVLRKKLGDDVKTIREAVQSAKDAVRAAGQALPPNASDKATSTSPNEAE